MRNRWWAAPLAAGATALIAACGSSGSPSASHSTTNAPAAHASATPQSGSNSSTVTIMTQSIGSNTVLTNGQGRTIYWFAIDTPTTSNCSGSCAQFWPPVIGKPVAASGTSLPKGFGTITRSNGAVQATYDGHPLYTYMGDTGSGQMTGNDKNLSGGLWWAMTPTGAKIGASGSGGSGGGGGYGY
jgi:predicted lipoprotein with Yx(FWY)xxD motif